MRTLPYITVGAIIEKIREDGLTTFSRPTFYRLEKRGKFKHVNYNKTDGGWRTFLPDNAVEIMTVIWANFFGQEAGKEYRKELKKRWN